MKPTFMLVSEAKAREVLEKIRVKPGLIGSGKALNSDFDFYFGYDRAESRFMARVTLNRGKSSTMYLEKDDVLTKGRSTWMTDNTWRLSPKGIDKVIASLRNVGIVANSLDAAAKLIARARAAATISARDQPVIDIHQEWSSIVRRLQKFEQRAFQDLLKEAVPYLRSVGLDLDPQQSNLGIEYRASDGPRLTGVLFVTERQENTVRHNDQKDGHKVAKWVETATGLSGYARKVGAYQWAVDLGE